MRNSTNIAEMRRFAPVFAALGDKTRLNLLIRLSRDGPRSTQALSKHSAVTRQAVSKHLHVLLRAGLIHDVRRGRERIWQFESKKLDEARRHLDQISRQWDSALARLKRFVDD